MCSGGLLVAVAALLATRATRAQFTEPFNEDNTNVRAETLMMGDFSISGSMEISSKTNDENREKTREKGSKNIKDRGHFDGDNSESESKGKQSSTDSKEIIEITKATERTTTKYYNRNYKKTKRPSIVELFGAKIKDQITPFSVQYIAITPAHEYKRDKHRAWGHKNRQPSHHENNYLRKRREKKMKDSGPRHERFKHFGHRHKIKHNRFIHKRLKHFRPKHKRFKHYRPIPQQAKYSRHRKKVANVEHRHKKIKHFRPRHRTHANYRRFMNKKICFENITDSEYADFIDGLDTLKDLNNSYNSGSDCSRYNDEFDFNIASSNPAEFTKSLYLLKRFQPEKFSSHKINTLRRENQFKDNKMLRKIVQTSSSHSNEANVFQEILMSAFRNRSFTASPQFGVDLDDSIFLKKNGRGYAIVKTEKRK